VSVEKLDVHRYMFPHTCKPGCPEQYKVCPHHACLPDTCREACDKFICYICTAPVPLAGGASQLVLHAKLYSIADKYIIPSLTKLSQEKFERACATHWEDDAFVSAADHVLTGTPDHDQGLRKILHNIFAEHSELLEKPSIEALLSKHASFTFGVLKRQGEELKGKEEEIKKLKEKK
jgi:hypothetical protein